MESIHVIPTDKPSRLYCHQNTKKFVLTNKIITRNINGVVNQNIYITSDEEIKEGDYVTNGEYVSQAINKWWTMFYIGNPELSADYWKIILTTDQDLIIDGVQAIDDEFLEWFVKNPSCEEVVIDFDYNSYKLGKSKSKCYKIIIPKEEIHLEDIFNDEKKEGIKKLIQKHKLASMMRDDEELGLYEEPHNLLPGFINQFEEGGEYQELTNEDWSVSQFLKWLKSNNFKIIK
jgi:hypothetical protein